MRRMVAMLVWGAVAACDRTAPPATTTGPAQPTPPPALAVAHGALIDAAEEIAEPNRSLTAGELAMIQPIFRDGIDYARVRVINNSFPLQPENVYMTPRGHVYAPGDLWQDDFSAGQSYRRAVFVHEMTHVWQFANGMDLIGQGVVEFTKHRGDYEKAYPYELDAARDLVEYGMEQQASIVEDYFLLTVEHDEPQRITNRGLSREQRGALYAAVLKQMTANARYARGVDPAQIAALHAKRSEQATPGPAACKESEQEHGAAHLCSWRFEPVQPR